MVFEYKRGTDLLKSRIESMDSLGSIFCYGDPKGFLYLNQLQIGPSEFVCKEATTARVSKSRIDKIEFLKLSGFIVVLTDSKVLLLDPATLDVKTKIKSGATTFAASPSDFIAVASGKKLHFFGYDTAAKQFLPYGDKKAKESSMPETIIRMGSYSCPCITFA